MNVHQKMNVGGFTLFASGGAITAWQGFAQLNDPYVGLGGALLAAAGTVGGVLTASGSSRFHAVPVLAGLANGVLTWGAVLKLMDPNSPEALKIAAVLLAAANGYGYFGANAAGLNGMLNPNASEGAKIDPQGHGAASTLSGATIGIAGWVLRDPILGSVGALFVVDGMLRGNGGERSYLDAFRTAFGVLRPDRFLMLPLRLAGSLLGKLKTPTVSRIRS